MAEPDRTKCETCGGAGFLESPSGNMYDCPECVARKWRRSVDERGAVTLSDGSPIKEEDFEE